MRSSLSRALVSLQLDRDPPCATIVYRDNRMNLCEGEFVHK